MQSTSFQWEKFPISLKLRETRSSTKKTKQVWAFTGIYDTIIALKAPLIVQLPHQFHEDYYPQCIPSSAWLRANAPWSQHEAYWRITVHVKNAFILCMQPVKKTKNQLSYSGIQSPLFAFTYVFVLPNWKNYCCVNSWDRKPQLEKQLQTLVFLFLPTYKIFHQFFIKKLQFLDSFKALKCVQWFSSQLSSLMYTRFINWNKAVK